VADGARVDVLVVRLSRRPLLHEVALLALDGTGLLEQRLRSEGYRPLRGSWWRAAAFGLERVDVVPASRWVAEDAARAMFSAAHPLSSRSHCRRPLAAHAVLLGALAAEAGPRRLAGGLPTSTDVSASARSRACSFAQEHGLAAAVPSGGTRP